MLSVSCFFCHGAWESCLQRLTWAALTHTVRCRGRGQAAGCMAWRGASWRGVQGERASLEASLKQQAAAHSATQMELRLARQWADQQQQVGGWVRGSWMVCVWGP